MVIILIIVIGVLVYLLIRRANPAQAGKGGKMGNNQVGTIRYAGFWLRFVAWIIDLIVGAIIFGIITFLLNLFLPLVGAILSFLLTFIFWWLYYGIMESSHRQATWGKMALSIKVTDLNGNRISFGKATVRYWAKIISGLILSIGYIMAGFTQKKQALHDMIAGCLVIKK
jgi:uncharacterized RDD family membrane protein YckC